MQSALPRESLEHSYECNVRPCGGGVAFRDGAARCVAGSARAILRTAAAAVRSSGMDESPRFLVREDEDEIVIKDT